MRWECTSQPGTASVWAPDQGQVLLVSCPLCSCRVRVFMSVDSRREGTASPPRTSVHPRQLGEHRDARLAYAVGRIAPFERADDSPATPLCGAIGEVAGERRDVLELQCEAAEWVAAQRVEAR